MATGEYAGERHPRDMKEGRTCPDPIELLSPPHVIKGHVKYRKTCMLSRTPDHLSCSVERSHMEAEVREGLGITARSTTSIQYMG
ncbi:hypothetical protein MicloDRAFT_00037600 [Microvirga lotononidis]|uniref:Uncharacterized protein n=1 Tax=Microvirga lotononidis TaxID=864069 RepID=I4YTB1_9HYPH|nr:hypothetical protein MicloDRAFT_00037600 [Microvirga lotononidis]